MLLLSCLLKIPPVGKPEGSYVHYHYCKKLKFMFLVDQLYLIVLTFSEAKEMFAIYLLAHKYGTDPNYIRYSTICVYQT